MIQLIFLIIVFLIYCSEYFISIRIVPSIADEYFYSLYSRLTPLAKSEIPNYLFLKLYSLTSVCESNFYFCVKFLNINFYFIAAFFLYKLARLYINRKKAFFIVLIFLIQPLSTVISYFIPESLYILCFFILLYHTLNDPENTTYFKFIVTGLLCALLYLIKPHGIIVMISIIIYYFLIVDYRKLLKLLLIPLSFYITKILLTYILVDRFSLNTLGGYYSGLLIKSYTFEALFKILYYSAFNFFGHISNCFVFLSIPVYFIVINFKSWRNDKDNIYYLSLLSIVMLISLMLMTSVFTAQVSVMGGGPYESYKRLNLRYYNFTFVLFYIICLCNAKINLVGSRILKFIYTVLIIIAILQFSSILNWTYDFFDAPEFYGLSSSKINNFLLILCLIILVFYKKFNRLFNNIFCFYLFVLYFTISSSVYYTLYSHTNNIYIDNVYLLKKIEKKSIIDNLVIIGSQPGSLYLSLLAADNIKTEAHYHDQNIPLNANDFKNKNLFLIDNYKLINCQKCKFQNVNNSILIRFIDE